MIQGLIDGYGALRVTATNEQDKDALADFIARGSQRGFFISASAYSAEKVVTFIEAKSTRKPKKKVRRP